MKKWFSRAYLYIMLAIMYAPIVLIIIFSFFNTDRFFDFSKGFSFESVSYTHLTLPTILRV